MKNRKIRKYTLLLILLLGISVGYALLSTTLKINGISIISKNSWNIYWDALGNEDGVNVTTLEIVDEDTTHKKNIVNFDVTFDKPGDFYEFQVDAVNAGTVDAEILEIESKYNDTVIPETGTSPLPSYLKYEVKYADDTEIKVGDKLLKRTDTSTFTRKRYKIRVEYDKDAVTISDVNNQDDAVTHSFSFKVVYGQARPSSSTAPEDFSTDSWETIEACAKAANCPYEVGDTKSIEVDVDDNGITETYHIRLVNTTTPAVCSQEGFSQTACGFVFEFLEPIGSTQLIGMNSTKTATGGWRDAEIRTYLNSTLINKLPEALKNVIINTYVVSGYGNGDTSNFETNDNIYFFSVKEVFGEKLSTGSYIDNADPYTRQLDYYESVGAVRYEDGDGQEVVRKYNINNEARFWLLRSARPSKQSFYGVVDDGRLGIFNPNSLGSTDPEWIYEWIVPAFRIG